MDITQVLALVAFVAIVGALALVLRGTSQLLARTRADESFRRSIGEVVERASTTIGGVLRLADPARYRTASGPELGGTALNANTTLGGLLGEARRMAVPLDRAAERDAIVADLVAATAALDTIVGVATGEASGTSEGRTQLKRGYLELAHAVGLLVDHGNVATIERPQPGRPRSEIGGRPTQPRSARRGDPR